MSLSTLSLVILLFPQGCERDNNHSDVIDMIQHFHKSGIVVETLQPLLPTVVRSQAAVALGIEGRQIGIYKYDLERVKQRERYEQIRKAGEVFIAGKPFVTRFNGSFMMIDFRHHPKEQEIIKAFDSFRPPSI